MKRLTAILVAGLFVLAPLSASAMEMMSDSNMKDVTGQAGVSIALDDVVLESWNGVTKYTDTDGSQTETIEMEDPGTYGNFVYEGDATEASVVLSDQHTVQDFQAITSQDLTTGELFSPGMGLARTGFMNLTVTIDGMDTNVSDRYDGYNFTPSALSIDVGTCAIMTDALAYKMNAAQAGLLDNGADLTGRDVENGYDDRTVAGVVIGLPTLEINTSASTQTIGIEQADAHNDGRNFIKIQQGESTLHVLGGTVEIAPH